MLPDGALMLPKSSEEAMIVLVVHGRLQGGGGVSSDLEGSMRFNR